MPNKTSLADAVKKVCKNWLIDDYINSNKIDLIISMITSLGIGKSNHLKKSFVMCLFKVSKVDQPEKNDIKEILNVTVYNSE